MSEGILADRVGSREPVRQRIILGSRGSELARAQTAMAAAALRQTWPELEIEARIIKTLGDTRGAATIDPGMGRKGLFTGEIEHALSAGEIDVAVHSAKDLPSLATPGLELCSVLPRGVVDDVLVRKVSGGLQPLQPRAIVATGSVRREHQLRWKHPGIQIVDLRGNVPTRLRNLVTNSWDAIVLARAGVERLGYRVSDGQFDFEGRQLYAEVLPFEHFVPAGGQGVIALQVRNNDQRAREIIDRVNHLETYSCLRAEREFLRLLAGDCNSPVGVLGTMEEDCLTLRAQVFEEINRPPKTERVCLSLRTQEPETISGALYRGMYEQS